MTKVAIRSLKQTEKNGLFSLVFENEAYSEFVRLSDSVLIAGGGGRKNTKTYNEDSNLNGYVISLQKLDELIKVEVKKGNITIESGLMKGIEDKTFEL